MTISSVPPSSSAVTVAGALPNPATRASAVRSLFGAALFSIGYLVFQVAVGLLTGRGNQAAQTEAPIDDVILGILIIIVLVLPFCFGVVYAVCAIAIKCSILTRSAAVLGIICGCLHFTIMCLYGLAVAADPGKPKSLIQYVSIAVYAALALGLARSISRSVKLLRQRKQ